MSTTTTNFGWTVPSDTDLVKDGAAAIRTALGGVDTSFVDLKGGTTGQVLSKASGTDLDFTWVAQDDSNAIQNAIVDAKGDLIVGASADTPARLAVGTNGYVLTANSSATNGVEWAAAASGAMVLTGSADFSTSSAVNINNCFSSTYLNYIVQVNLTASSATDADILWRMRVSGSDDSSSNYQEQRIYQRSTTVGGYASTQTYQLLGNTATSHASKTLYELNLADPYIAKPTVWSSTSNSWNSSAENYQYRFTGCHNVSTSYDGITIYPSSGNITGKIRIFGYKLS